MVLVIVFFLSAVGAIAAAPIFSVRLSPGSRKHMHCIRSLRAPMAKIQRVCERRDCPVNPFSCGHKTLFVPFARLFFSLSCRSKMAPDTRQQQHINLENSVKIRNKLLAVSSVATRFATILIYQKFNLCIFMRSISDAITPMQWFGKC